jgi:exopolysaccharide production protein ExoZ
MKSAGSSRLDLLQALRALAALLVVGDHAILNLVEKAGLDGSKRELAYIFGHSGVSIFFEISGFIMIYTSFHLFAKEGASVEFLIRRILRIGPLYWAISFIIVLKLIIINSPISAMEVLKSFTFIPFLDQDGKYRPIYGLGWTLNYEILFYLVFSFALILRRRIGLSFLFITLIGFVLAGRYWEPGKTGDGLGLALAFWMDPIILLFLGGVALGLLRIKCNELNRLSPLSFDQGLVLVLLCLGLLVLYALYNPPVSSSEFALVTGVTLVVAIGAMDANLKTGGFIHRWFLLLGNASYSIYLTHSFLVGPCSRIWVNLVPSILWPLFIIIMLIGSSILGLLTYSYIERPMTEYLLRMRGKLTPKTMRPVEDRV